jgi:hypothetical protein
MEGSYVECTVMAAKSPKFFAVKCLIVAAMVITVFPGVLFLGSFVIVLLAALAVAAWFIFPKGSFAYEYVFCDGQMEFSKITGAKQHQGIQSKDLEGTGQGADMQLISGESRKLLKKIDFDNVEICAPQHSHALDEFNNKQNLKISDYSSHINDRRKFALIYSKGEVFEKIVFEPNDVLLNAIKQKSPRKISEI